MVDYLRRSGLVPDQPRPSIETLLHAFVPAPHVDHTHPDAIIALASPPDGERLVEEAFGDEAVWLPYERPGFAMSRTIAELLDANPRARAVILEKHGLVTWGETGEESYRATIEFVTRAAAALERARRRALRPRRREGRAARRRRVAGAAAGGAAGAARRAARRHRRRSCSRSTAAPRRSRSHRPRASPRSRASARPAPTT